MYDCGFRRTATLADGIRGSGIIVHLTQATQSNDFASFQAALTAATDQFSGQFLCAGLDLSPSNWWGGSHRPSVVDVTSRFAVLTRASVRQISLVLDWADPV